MATPHDAGDTDNVRAVRALAHPLRLRLLDELRFGGPATATMLGQRVGESSGATSYHLRQLARHGYVEDAEPRGGRERWWRYRERRVVVPQGDDPTGNRTLLAELLSREAHALDRYLADPARTAGWDDAAFFQSRALRLTAAELDALRDGIEALLAPLRRADAENPPTDTSPVRVLAFGFPLPLEES
ncbi:MAG TPA: helix-turn-helix domain-containing protein [Gaiellales bacterium]